MDTKLDCLHRAGSRTEPVPMHVDIKLKEMIIKNIMNIINKQLRNLAKCRLNALWYTVLIESSVDHQLK